jgi:membrane protease YdiL (CAAX protease family)
MAAAFSYAVIVYLASWSLWALAACLRPPAGLAETASLPGVFAPAIVGMAFVAWQGGTGAVREVLARVVKWRVHFGFYLFALLFIAAIKLAVAVIYRIETGGWPRFGTESPVELLAASLLSTPFQAGEELGWRGYLLPSLAGRTGYGLASLIIGPVWAAWHLPLFFLAWGGHNGQSFILYLGQVTALSVAMAWLYARTGSLLLTMIMHAAGNNSLGIVPSATASTSPADVFSLHVSLVGALTAGLLWVAAPVFLATMPKLRADQSD